MNHLEIEYKTLLDKEEYQSLLPLFADTELVVQTNHYIDTPDQSSSVRKKWPCGCVLSQIRLN